MKKIAMLLTLLASPAMAEEPAMPRIPTEAEKIEALKLGYIMNGFSMVRMGSIDLTDHFRQEQEVYGPPAPPPPAVAKGKK